MLITKDDDGQRLDRFLQKAFPTLSFGQAQKLIRTGQIRVNGSRAKGDSRLCLNDELRLPPSLAHDNRIHEKRFSQKDRDFIQSIILYEDDHILALNKPAGLAVQGGSKTSRHIDDMLNSYEKKGVKPRLCHRLDKDTSGVLILAKGAESARSLAKAFQGKDIQKTYWAVCAPAPLQANGTINAPLSKSAIRGDGGEMMIHDPDNGRNAVTNFEVIDNAGNEAAFVAFYPLTGRTHQIRVHAALISAPLLGDRKYNPDPWPIDNDDLYKGLHLHARSITLPHPFTNKPITIMADLHDGFLKTMKTFGFVMK